jgi:hypothetical protein
MARGETDRSDAALTIVIHRMVRGETDRSDAALTIVNRSLVRGETDRSDAAFTIFIHSSLVRGEIHRSDAAFTIFIQQLGGARLNGWRNEYSTTGNRTQVISVTGRYTALYYCGAFYECLDEEASAN